MRTLLNIGDIIRIRGDIKEDTPYEMILDTDCKNSWIKYEMLPAGTLVEITGFSHGQYEVRRLEKVDSNLAPIDLPDSFWSYTDTMFDPELLMILLEDRYN